MIRPFTLTTTEYQQTGPYPYMILDEPLDHQTAIALQREILTLPEHLFDRYDNPFEQKYTLRDKFNLPPTLTTLFEYLCSDEFVSRLSLLTGISLHNDPTRNFWGIHKYSHGDKLDVHVDAGTHPATGAKKQVTLGIYLSKNWDETCGGHLEIWDGTDSSIDTPVITKCVAKVLPQFNRMIVFNNEDNSWHGNPDPVTCDDGAQRIFVTLSYLSHDNAKYRNCRCKAYFVARPEDPIDAEKDRLRILRADPEKYKEVYRYRM